MTTACDECDGTRPEPLEASEIAHIQDSGAIFLVGTTGDLQVGANFNQADDLTIQVVVEPGYQGGVLNGFAGRTFTRETSSEFLNAVFPLITQPTEVRDTGFV